MARRRRTVETIKITIAPTFGEVKTISVEEGATVADALRAGGFNEDVEVRINGEGTVESDAIVEDGDELTIIAGGKIEAACR